MLLFLSFLFLARVRNPERLRYQAPGEWGLILGLDRGPETKTLRRKIRAISSEKKAVVDWKKSLTTEWAMRMDDGTLAVDGHVKTYSGRKGNLQKRFVPRQKLCPRRVRSAGSTPWAERRSCAYTASSIPGWCDRSRPKPFQLSSSSASCRRTRPT